MPTLLGPGWKSIDISKQTSSSGSGSNGSTNKSLEQLKALGARPVEVAQEPHASPPRASTDTIAADLDFAALIADVSSLSNSPITPKDQKQLDELESGIKTAHVSESFDHSSHLPSALSAEFAVDVPADLQKDANGLTGRRLQGRRHVQRLELGLLGHGPVGRDAAQLRRPLRRPRAGRLAAAAWGRLDSNQRPNDYESSALTAELRPRRAVSS